MFSILSDKMICMALPRQRAPQLILSRDPRGWIDVPRGHSRNDGRPFVTKDSLGLNLGVHSTDRITRLAIH